MFGSTIADDRMQFTVINKFCDVKSAWGLQDIKIGYFLNWSFGDMALEADIPVRDPQNFDKIIHAVAVIEKVKWDGLANSLIDVQGRVSPKNKALMQESICLLDGRFECQAEWVVYEYDQAAGKYYRSFHTDEKSINLTLCQHFAVFQEPDSSIIIPANYCFDLSFAADSEVRDQKLFFAFRANGKTFSRTFGPE